MERRLIAGVVIAVALVLAAVVSTTLYLLYKPVALSIPPSDYSTLYKVINLRHREDRRRRMEAEFAAAGIGSYAFVEAENGKHLILAPSLQKIFAGNDFAWHRGVLGCALSHYKLWKALLADSEHDHYIVLEDDIKLCTEFSDKVQKVLAAAKPYDVIFLSYTVPKKQLQQAATLTVRPLHASLYVGGTFAYYVSKRGATAMVAHWETVGIRRAIDAEMVFNMKGVRFGECNPFLASTQSLETDIGR